MGLFLFLFLLLAFFEKKWNSELTRSHIGKWILLSEQHWKGASVTIFLQKVPTIIHYLIWPHMPGSFNISCLYFYRQFFFFLKNANCTRTRPYMAKWTLPLEFCIFWFLAKKSSHSHILPNLVTSAQNKHHHQNHIEILHLLIPICYTCLIWSCPNLVLYLFSGYYIIIS